MFAFVELKTDHLQLAPGQKVLKAIEYSRYLQAAELVAAAKEKAIQIQAEAQIAYEAEKDRGYQDGLEKVRQQQSQLLIEAQTARDQFLVNAEQELANLVLSAVKSVMQGFDQVDLTLNITREAITHARHQKTITLRVHPELAEKVSDRIQDMLGELTDIGFIEVVGDQRVKSAGCILETETGVVDATLESQLSALNFGIRKALTDNASE
jgi:type III secretion protein L